MDIRKVKKLIELLEESNISEIEIQEGEESVRISHHPNGFGAMQQPMVMQQQQPMAPSAPAAPSAPVAEAGDAAPAQPAGHAVTSPMVGTFYLPGAGRQGVR